MLQTELGFELKSGTREFVSQECVFPFINGQYVSAADETAFEVLDPGSGGRLTSVAACGKAEIEAAVSAGENAFKTSGWAKMPVNERAVLLGILTP